MKLPEYIRFDEVADVVSSVNLGARLVTQLETESHLWKWMIVATHSALQGAFVCAMSGSAGVGALDKKSQNAVNTHIEESRTNDEAQWPQVRLADFNELLKRAEQAECMNYLGGTPLTLTKQEREDLKRLHKVFRNNFIHFTPKGWSIESVGLPRIILTAFKATETIMLHHPAPHVDTIQKKVLARDLKAIEATLASAAQPEAA